MPKTEARLAFVGVGETPASRRPEMSEADYVIEACRKALEDAGLEPSLVDGLSIHRWGGDIDDSAPIVEALGLGEIRWTGGGSGPAGLGDVAQALDAGLCKAVLVCKVMSTVNQFTTAPGQIPYEVFENCYGLGHAHERRAFDLRRYLHRYNATREQLGWLCIVQREHAMLNPSAYFQTPLTMEDYINSRNLADPVHLFDCDIPVNGAWACLMVSDALAQNLRHPPVYLLGWAVARGTGQPGHMDPMPDGMGPVGTTLWQDTGLRPQDIDLCNVYDGFSWLAPFWLETLGILKQGESFAFMEGGERIRYTGELPINTHGGSLSAGRSHGQGQINESIVQLRGAAGKRQVAGNPQFAVITFAFPQGGSAGVLGRL